MDFEIMFKYSLLLAMVLAGVVFAYFAIKAKDFAEKAAFGLMSVFMIAFAIVSDINKVILVEIGMVVATIALTTATVCGKKAYAGMALFFGTVSAGMLFHNVPFSITIGSVAITTIGIILMAVIFTAFVMILFTVGITMDGTTKIATDTKFGNSRINPPSGRVNQIG